MLVNHPNYETELMGTPEDSKKTRAKIIEASGRLFADRGYDGVTVRDIVKKAKTHPGALNYHFGSKKSLYREVLLKACDDSSMPPEDQEQLLSQDPRDALYMSITESIKNYQELTAKWQSDLLTRECYQPSSVFTEVVDGYFKPETDFMISIVRKIVDKPVDDIQVRLAVIIMSGLINTFVTYRRLIEMITPGLNDHLNNEDLLARQIFHLVVEVAKGPVVE